MRPSQGLPSVMVGLTEMVGREQDSELKRDALKAVAALAPKGCVAYIRQNLSILNWNDVDDSRLHK